VTYLPYVIVLFVIGGLMMLTQRNRRRQVVAEQERAEQITAGTEVMTTSGLYGTVVSKIDDETVLLAIAPGVEVKWALAALRDASSLADRYRGGLAKDSPPEPAEIADSGSTELEADPAVNLDKLDREDRG
jgi:preprotein translocase subunit YajC